MTYIAPQGRVQFYNEFGLSPNYENSLYFASKTARNNYFDTNLTPIAEATTLSYTRSERGFIRVQKTMAELIGAGYMRFRNAGFENKWFYAFVKGVRYINNECTEVQFELDYIMTWMGDFTLQPCMVERMHQPVSDNIGDNIVDENLPVGDVMYGKPISSGRVGSDGWTFCFASTFDPNELAPEPTPTPDPEEPEEPDPEEPEVELPDPETGEGDNPSGYVDGIKVIQGDGTTLEPWEGGMYGGIYSGLHYEYYHSADTLNQWIQRAVNAGKADGIVGISICPASFQMNDGDNVKQYTIHPLNKPTKGSAFKQGSHSYTPRNAKMYIYPYCYMSLTNMEGNWADFRYEMFDTADCNFTIQGVSGLQTDIVVSPQNYKWNKDDTPLQGEWIANPAEKMSMSDFPMCSYITDPFKAYLAQNKSSIMAGVVSTAIGAASQIGLAIATGGGSLVGTTITQAAGVAGELGAYAGVEQTDRYTYGSGGGLASVKSLTGAAQNAAKFIGSLMDYARKPMQMNGSQGTSALFGSLIPQSGEDPIRVFKEFWFFPRTITPEYARVIDDYFTMYGYKQGKVMTPQMCVRAHWTYVKTVGCTISGPLPADHARVIEDIFDNGIRFWVNHTEIGQYGLVNSPT